VRLFFFICLLVLQLPLSAQSPAPDTLITDLIFKIDSVTITGNHITDDDIILGELTFKPGEMIDSLILAYNKERIYSLQLFTKVSLDVAKQDGYNRLYINVSEGWYIYPLPYLYMHEKDINKLSFGAELKWFNFRGRNENIYMRAGFGYDPSYVLNYYIPYLSRKEEISFQSSLEYVTSKNRSIQADALFGDEFNYKTFKYLLGLGKRVNIFNKIDIYAGFSYLEAPRYVKGITASSSNIDRFGFAGARYTYDKRDLRQFPTDGNFFSAEYIYKGIGNSEISHHELTLDYRNYFNITGSLYTKYRLSTNQVFGDNIPYYDYAFLGTTEKIRGHFFSKREGKSIYTTSLEAYYIVFKDWHLEFDLPLIPKSLTSYRIGLAFQVFADAGIAKNPEDSFAWDQFSKGYGFGMTVLSLPYNVARIEVAFNERRVAQLILDFGIMF